MWGDLNERTCGYVALRLSRSLESLAKKSRYYFVALVIYHCFQLTKWFVAQRFCSY